AFQTYGTCKHLAAVLIAISEEGPPEKEGEKPSQVTQSPRSYNETNQLIQVLSDYQPEPGRSNTRADELKVEFTLKASSYPTLRKS
ncbi:hypothetical protein R0K20_21570, partial [Staphylococcus sp. SIMBA_130]